MFRKGKSFSQLARGRSGSWTAAVAVLLTTIGFAHDGHPVSVADPGVGAPTPNGAQSSREVRPTDGGGTLPAAAQALISSAIGKDQDVYHAVREAAGVRLDNPDHAVSASFTSAGVRFRLGTSQWGLKLRGHGYGDGLVDAKPVAPIASANRVEDPTRCVDRMVCQRSDRSRAGFHAAGGTGACGRSAADSGIHCRRRSRGLGRSGRAGPDAQQERCGRVPLRRAEGVGCQRARAPDLARDGGQGVASARRRCRCAVPGHHRPGRSGRQARCPDDALRQSRTTTALQGISWDGRLRSAMMAARSSLARRSSASTTSGQASPMCS